MISRMAPHELKLEADRDIDAGPNLRQYWNGARRRKWAILGLAGAVSVVAALFALSLTTYYWTSAIILIESQQANVVSIEEVYALDTRSQQYLATQLEILDSRPLAEKVVEELDLADHPEFYFSEEDDEDEGFDLSWLSWLPFDIAERSEAIETGPMRKVVDAYRSGLTVTPIRDTQLLRVGFESEDPALAARIANAHAQAYIDSLRESRIDATESAGAWITERLVGMERTLRESERKLQAFREEEKLVDVEGLKAMPADDVKDLSSRLVAARRVLSQAEIAYLQIPAGGEVSPDYLQGIPAVMDDEVVQSFQRTEARFKQRIAELEKRYGPMHPSMIAAQSELAEASRNLRAQQDSVVAAIRNKYESAVAEEAALLRALGVAEQQYQKIGSKESELNALQREVDANRELYELFYNRIGETDVTAELDSVQARIVSPAVIPTRHDSPNREAIVAWSFVLTLAAGVVLARLLEAMNSTVRSSSDVSKKLRQTLLGMVPLLKGKRKQRRLGAMFFDNDEHRFSESIRTIRTAVSLNNLDRPYKVILVTSSIGREGKSTIAMNLAHAFSQSESVLLLDADMRRPSIGQQLNLPGDAPGLAHLLEGEMKLEDVIVRGVSGRADVIPHGSIKDDPPKWLSSSRMANALLVLQKHYDRIIIDTPPVLPVSDALILSKRAGAVVFVAKADATPARQINQALQLLERVDAPLVGVVINQLDVRKAEKYSDYGYGGYYKSYESASPAN